MKKGRSAGSFITAPNTSPYGFSALFSLPTNCPTVCSPVHMRPSGKIAQS